MANYYTQFSFTVTGLSKPAYRRWAAWLDAHAPASVLPQESSALSENTDEEDTGKPWSFAHSYDENAPEELHIWSEETGNPDHVAVALQKLLCLRGEARTLLTFEVAYACSKMRPQSFGGAAHRITPDRIIIFDTHALARQETPVLAALEKLAAAVDLAGGAVQNEDGTLSPSILPEWTGLGEAYALAVEALRQIGVRRSGPLFSEDS